MVTFNLNTQGHAKVIESPSSDTTLSSFPGKLGKFELFGFPLEPPKDQYYIPFEIEDYNFPYLPIEPSKKLKQPKKPKPPGVKNKNKILLEQVSVPRIPPPRKLNKSSVEMSQHNSNTSLSREKQRKVIKKRKETASSSSVRSLSSTPSSNLVVPPSIPNSIVAPNLQVKAPVKKKKSKKEASEQEEAAVVKPKHLFVSRVAKKGTKKEAKSAGG